MYDGVYMTDDEFLSNFRMDRACIHQLNELVKSAIPQDWIEDNMETEDDEELEQHNNERANWRDQILAYMMEMR